MAIKDVTKTLMTMHKKEIVNPVLYLSKVSKYKN